MATDEDIVSRLDRILIRVKSGSTISEALQVENCTNWFYRKIKNADRAPIVAARREYEERQRQLAQHPGAPMPETVGVLVEFPFGRKQDFQQLCQQMGTSMSRRINTLVAADLSANRGIL